jgi:hypothetical protein
MAAVCRHLAAVAGGGNMLRSLFDLDEPDPRKRVRSLR